MPSTLGIVASHRTPPFTPANLTGLQVWYDASDTATITHSAGAVSQINDKSGLGRHATQSTAAAKPTTGTVTQNGKNVLAHDGGDFMFAGATKPPWKFLHDGTDVLIGAVWNPGPASNVSLIGNTPVGSAVPAFRLFVIATSTRMTMIISSPGGAGAVVNNVASARIVFATANLTTTLSDPDNATASARSSIFLNAGTGFGGNAVTGAPSTADPSFVTMLGANPTSDTVGTNLIGAGGWWGEIVIVAGAEATEANRVRLRDYLNTKWTVY